ATWCRPPLAEVVEVGECSITASGLPQPTTAPHAGAHLLPEAGATQERTLFHVACTPECGARCDPTSCYARPAPISISALITRRPPDSNAASLTCTSSLTARRLAAGSARYACGICPVPASRGAQ